MVVASKEDLNKSDIGDLENFLSTMNIEKSELVNNLVKMNQTLIRQVEELQKTVSEKDETIK